MRVEINGAYRKRDASFTRCVPFFDFMQWFLDAFPNLQLDLYSRFLHE